MNKVIGNPGISLREAMKQLNISGEKSLVIADENNILFGTLSDGDIRRAILSGVNIETSIENFYNVSPKTIKQGEIDFKYIKKLFTLNRYDLIPVIDSKNKLVDILTYKKIFNDDEPSKRKLGLNVMIMAGGEGKRLEPFTKILPKPLAPINDRPIIEHIIDKFLRSGCSDFFISVNYKSKILKAFFEELDHSYSIKYIEEKKPLGTAGSLSFIKDVFHDSFFVTNCDIIIDIDYKDIYDFHKANEFDLTLVASTNEFIIPYGICDLDSMGNFIGINEKPKFNFLVNAGLYLMEPKVLKLIPVNKKYDLTDLIKNVKKKSGRIGVYPIFEDAWKDIGLWSKYIEINKIV